MAGVAGSRGGTPFSIGSEFAESRIEIGPSAGARAYAEFMSGHEVKQARVIPLRPIQAVPASPVTPAPTPPAPQAKEPLWRDIVGDVLRRERRAQERTLREVAEAARMSMPYLSEIERGRKEASSEVLAAAAHALGLSLADVLRLAHFELIHRDQIRRLASSTSLAGTPRRADAQMWAGRRQSEMRLAA